MNLQEMWDTICKHWPEGGVGGGGILLCLIAFKLCRGTLRWVLVIAALGLVAAAVLSVLHNR